MQSDGESSELAEEAEQRPSSRLSKRRLFLGPYAVPTHHNCIINEGELSGTFSLEPKINVGNLGIRHQ